jgi:PPOX class probable F420-dependent enzyme
MPNAFDPLRGEKYIDLVTYRKSGVGVHTPVWFAEHEGRLFVMTRPDFGKAKRIRNRPQVEVAPCTVRGRRRGSALLAVARVSDDGALGRRLIRGKYWLARLPIWSRENVYLEISPSA